MLPPSRRGSGGDIFIRKIRLYIFGRCLRSKLGLLLGPMHNLKELKCRRNELRLSQTRAEKHLWSHLRRKQLQGRKFRRQHSVGRYILDFYCTSHRLAIEVDGVHHSNPAVQNWDNERTRFLSGQGIQVLRFRNEDVLDKTDWVIDCILKQLSLPPPASRRRGSSCNNLWAQKNPAWFLSGVFFDNRATPQRGVRGGLPLQDFMNE